MQELTSSYTLAELLAKIKDDTGQRVSKRTVYWYRQQGLLPPPSGAGRAARYSDEHAALIGAINQMVRTEHRPIADIRAMLEGGEQISMDSQAMAQIAGSQANILLSSVNLPVPALPEAPEPLNFGAGIDGGYPISAASSTLETDSVGIPHESARAYVQRVLRPGSGSSPHFSPVSSPTGSYPYLYPTPTASGGITGSRGPDTGAPKAGQATPLAWGPGGPSPQAPFDESPGGLPRRPGGPSPSGLPEVPSTPSYLTPRSSERSTWERIYLAADLELAVRRPTTRESNRALTRIIESAKAILEEEGIK